jgi:hypothetical protein
MQWSRASFVLVFDVGSSVEKELNHGLLFGGTPYLSSFRPRIACIVECDSSPPILGVQVSSRFDQRPDGARLESGCRNVECCISSVQLVRDFLYESFVGDAILRNFGFRSHESHRLGFIRHNSSGELDKGCFSMRHDR